MGEGCQEEGRACEPAGPARTWGWRERGAEGGRRRERRGWLRLGAGVFQQGIKGLKHRIRWSSGPERQKESKEIPTPNNASGGRTARQHLVDGVSRTWEGAQAEDAGLQMILRVI